VCVCVCMCVCISSTVEHANYRHYSLLSVLQLRDRVSTYLKTQQEMQNDFIATTNEACLHLSSCLIC